MTSAPRSPSSVAPKDPATKVPKSRTRSPANGPAAELVDMGCAENNRAMATRRASFRRFAIATIAAVYFLILVGGLVRASGSGMGCPDWPRCFGRWIPPTSESQLPADYQERWAEHGYGEARFNVWKTWTEYGNRMISVVIGLLIFVTLIIAFLRYRRDDPTLVWWCLAAFLLVGFAGW